MDSLPPVMAKRQGGFEMIPDFLKMKEVQKDMNNINSLDMMQEAFKKQDESNQNQPSMSELLAEKRRKAEEAIQNAKPKDNDVEERKARLIA